MFLDRFFLFFYFIFMILDYRCPCFFFFFSLTVFTVKSLNVNQTKKSQNNLTACMEAIQMENSYL